MQQSTEPALLSQDEADAFTVLVLRYLDGDCGAEEFEQLRDRLAGSTQCRELFVQTCRVFGRMHENYAARRAERAAIGAAAGATQRSALEIGAGAGSDQDDAVADLLAAAQGDPGAETIVHDASPDDTANPPPQN